MNQLKNIFLMILNMAIFAVAMPILEYDLSKTLKPQFEWLPTIPALDITLISIASIIAIYNISILFLVVVKDLRNFRRWTWFSTIMAWFLIAVVVLVLGTSFLPIISGIII